MARIAGVVAGMQIAGVGSGCGTGAPQPPPPEREPARAVMQVEVAPPPPAPEVRRVPAPSIALPHQLQARLLEPGASPREALRYAAPSGERTHDVELWLGGRTLREGRWSEPPALPPFTTPLALAPGAAPDALVVRPLAPRVEDGGDAAALAPYLEGWRALVGAEVVLGRDARGQLAGLDRVRDDLAQRLLALAVPLPDEPIGVGARWEVTTALRHRPAIVKQTARYRLAQKTPRRWTIEVEVERSGEPQLVEDAPAPSGHIVEVVALQWRLAGVVEVEPGAALPVAGRLTLSSTLHLRTSPTAPGAATAPREDIVEDSGAVILTTAAAR